MMKGWGGASTLTIWYNTACLHCGAAQSTKNHESQMIPFWMLKYLLVCPYRRARWKCVYDGACSCISASVRNCVHVQNTLKYRRSTPASPRDCKGWKSIYNPNTQHQKGTQSGAKEQRRRGVGMSTMFEWESSGWMRRWYSCRKRWCWPIPVWWRL